MHNFILIFTFLFLNTHATNNHGYVVHLKEDISDLRFFERNDNWIILYVVDWDSASRRFQPIFEKAYA